MNTKLDKIQSRQEGVCQADAKQPTSSHLLLIQLELGCVRLRQAHRERAYGVVVRTALKSREDGAVDCRLQLVAPLLAPLEKDHAAARAAQGLVGRGGDDVGVFEGRRHDVGSHQP